jgi:hypothetical protein
VGQASCWGSGADGLGWGQGEPIQEGQQGTCLSTLHSTVGPSAPTGARAAAGKVKRPRDHRGNVAARLRYGMSASDLPLPTKRLAGRAGVCGQVVPRAPITPCG